MIRRPHLVLATSTVLIAGLATTTASNTQKKGISQTTRTNKGVLDAKEIARRVLPSVLLLMCDDGAGRGSLGSGFVVRPGIVVTNYHVIKDMVRGTARSASTGRDEPKRGWRISSVRALDEDSDLALLQVPGAEQAGVPALSLATGAGVIPGETIYALGNPEGLVGTISPGIVAATLRSFEQGSRIQITAPISRGSSGGPVVNSRAEVVGVAQGSLTEGQNLNFAVPARFVLSLLSQMDAGRDSIYGNVANAEGSWSVPLTFESASASNSKPQKSGEIGPLRPNESASRASLRKLKAVEVMVEQLSPDTARVVSAVQIQTAIELRLRRSGIKVLNKGEMWNTPGNPHLYLDLNVMSMSNQAGYLTGYAYYFTLALKQGAKLDRDETFGTFAATWHDAGMGYSGRQYDTGPYILQDILEKIDRFINDYLAAQ